MSETWQIRDRLNSRSETGPWLHVSRGAFAAGIAEARARGISNITLAGSLDEPLDLSQFPQLAAFATGLSFSNISKQEWLTIHEQGLPSKLRCLFRVPTLFLDQIGRMKALEELHLECEGSAVERIDLAQRLGFLRIDGFAGPLGNLSVDLLPNGRLELFSLGAASLGGIGRIGHLADLKIVNTLRLKDLAGIADCTELQSLEFEYVKIKDYAVLARLETLTSLQIRSKMCSCAFVEHMPALEFFGAYADIEDGDLTPLLRSQSLRSIFIKPNKKYGSTYAELKRKFPPDQSDTELLKTLKIIS